MDRPNLDPYGIKPQDKGAGHFFTNGRMEVQKY